MSISVKKGATKEYRPDPGNRYGEYAVSTPSNTKYPLVHTCEKECRSKIIPRTLHYLINNFHVLCVIYFPKADGLTYTELCVKFPKGNPIGILTSAETPSSYCGTERVFTPSVTPKGMYDIGVADTLVAAQVEIYYIAMQGNVYMCIHHFSECS